VAAKRFCKPKSAPTAQVDSFAPELCYSSHGHSRGTSANVASRESVASAESLQLARHSPGALRAGAAILNPEQITYPPLDTLKPATKGVWIVDSGPMIAMGFVPLPIRMTVVRLDDGSLLLHSPTRFTASLKQELEQIGTIAHLVAPNSAHWMFVKEWQDRCPTARVWAAPGLGKRRHVRRMGVRIDQEMRAGPLRHWPAEIDRILIEGLGFAEVALFVKQANLVVVTDLVLNLEAPKLPLLFRPAARLAGVLAPGGKAPLYLRALIRFKGRQARPAAERLLAYKPDFAIFTHGRWFHGDAEQKLRKSLAWLLR
jgi:hypothetical protein